MSCEADLEHIWQIPLLEGVLHCISICNIRQDSEVQYVPKHQQHQLFLPEPSCASD
jgi:hypothetical protein